MASRILKGAVFAGLVLASAGNAENCKEAVLYDGSKINGQMEESGRTFPEAPEWRANWGDFTNMKAPYMRLSGIKNGAGDWTGTLSLQGLPIGVEGGTFSITARSTQNAKFGVWLAGSTGTGNVVFHTLKANSTQVITVNVRDLLGSTSATVNKVGFGLFGVPAYQYTTLFVDNIKLSCTGGAQAGSTGSGSVTGGASAGNGEYAFRDVNPSSSVREFDAEPLPDAKKALNEETRREYSNRTARQFVLTEHEHQQVTKFQTASNLTPEGSRSGWYKSMFTIDRKRLKDSVIASPKNLFIEAGESPRVCLERCPHRLRELHEHGRVPEIPEYLGDAEGLRLLLQLVEGPCLVRTQVDTVDDEERPADCNFEPGGFVYDRVDYPEAGFCRCAGYSGEAVSCGAGGVALSMYRDARVAVAQ